MKHPLAWNSGPISPEILTPFSMNVIEGASSFLPYFEEEDEGIAVSSINFFLLSIKEWADLRWVNVGTPDREATVPSPIRYKTDFEISYDTDFSEPKLQSTRDPRMAEPAWLITVRTPDEMRDVIDYVQDQSDLELFAEVPEDLRLGLWLELSTKPPVSGPLAPFAPTVFTHVPGTQLYEFLPRGAESN